MCSGPERRKLKTKDPQRYSWNPKEVLAQIAAIYVHLARADAAGVLAREIANDERCYREAMFPEAAQVRKALLRWQLSTKECQSALEVFYAGVGAALYVLCWLMILKLFPDKRALHRSFLKSYIL